jgi:predicted ATPase
VTVTGPGGVGKTRLAIEVAGRQVGRRPNGVWLVDLTAGSDPAAFKNITAAAAGVLAAMGTAPHQTKPGRASDRDAERTIHGLASARSTGGRSQRE